MTKRVIDHDETVAFQMVGQQVHVIHTIVGQKGVQVSFHVVDETTMSIRFIPAPKPLY